MNRTEMLRADILLLAGLVGSLSGYVFVRLMNARWKHRTQAEWVGQDMLLRQPPMRSKLGVGLIASLPLILWGVTLVRGPSNPMDLPSIVLASASVLLAGWVLWAAGRRHVTVNEKAIELHGIWGRRIAWSELATVEGYSFPHRKVLVFSRGHGKGIAVDSTHYGWEEFLEKVSELAPQAGSKVVRAMERLETGR